jgi:hypothetical protein
MSSGMDGAPSLFGTTDTPGPVAAAVEEEEEEEEEERLRRKTHDNDDCVTGLFVILAGLSEICALRYCNCTAVEEECCVAERV